MEFFHISYKSYAEEYEEFVTQKFEQQSQKSKPARKTRTHEPDYYEILGVDRSASEEEIKRAFRVLIMQVHPDYYQLQCRGGVTCSGPDAEEKTQKLLEAYKTLRNPEKRYIYDLSLHSCVLLVNRERFLTCASAPLLSLPLRPLPLLRRPPRSRSHSL